MIIKLYLIIVFMTSNGAIVTHEQWIQVTGKKSCTALARELLPQHTTLLTARCTR